MSAALLVLGGSSPVAPALRWAREAGLHTVLVDSDPDTALRREAAEFQRIPAGEREALVALARRLARTRGLAGVLPSCAASFTWLPCLSEAVPGCLSSVGALERLRSAESARAFLALRGLPVTAGEGLEEERLDVFAVLREGAFVPGGVARRTRTASGDERSVQPAGLGPGLERAAYALVERAARVAGCERGLVQATLRESRGSLALEALWPGFVDLLGAGPVAWLALGKSPLQAWFAHLAGVGGPFDELALGAQRAAGWLTIAPDRPGLFAGVDGRARARALPGVVGLWIEEPGRRLASPELAQPALGHVWAEAPDVPTLEQRLEEARGALTVRVAGRERVA